MDANARTGQEDIMGDVQVVHPKGGSPIVKDEAECMPSGERVTWSFLTDDPRIDSFEVEFSDPKKHAFFKEHSPKHKYNQKVKNYRAEIYGHVPQYSGSTTVVVAKYTVRGLDAVGAKVFEKDPVIFTPKP